MNINLDKYPVTKYLVENENARLKVESTGALGEQMDYRLHLNSKVGKQLATSYSKNSIEKCLNNIEKNIREKLNEDYDKSKPYEVLQRAIKNISLLKTREYGQDKVGGLRISSINYLEDEDNNLVSVPVSIGIGNAGNNVIHFDALQRGSWIDVNAGWVKHHLTGHEAMMDVIDAIDTYLYSKLEVRTAEMEELKEKNGRRIKPHKK